LREPHDDFETTARGVAWGEFLLLFVKDEGEDDDCRLASNPPGIREGHLHLSFVNKAPSSSEDPSCGDGGDGGGGGGGGGGVE